MRPNRLPAATAALRLQTCMSSRQPDNAINETTERRTQFFSNRMQRTANGNHSKPRAQRHTAQSHIQRQSLTFSAAESAGKGAALKHSTAQPKQSTSAARSNSNLMRYAPLNSPPMQEDTSIFTRKSKSAQFPRLHKEHKEGECAGSIPSVCN